jgi:TatA/E family protein of Tat protein translocase
MGQLGISELIFIFIIALLVFGPKKLPDLGKSLGKGLKEFKKAKDDLTSTWHEQMKDVERSVEEVKTTVNEAANELRPELDLKSQFYEPFQEKSEPAPAEPAKSAEKVESKEVHQT